MTIGVPSAIKTFNWLGTLWGGKIQFTTAMLFALGFVSLFVTGGLSGLFLAQPSLDLYLHDTYFVVAHFHLIMGVAAIFGIFAATYFWFPKMFGRMLNETHRQGPFLAHVRRRLLHLHAHALSGLAGNPRRYADLTGVNFLAPLHSVHYFITIAAMITITAQLLFLFNFFYSMIAGKKATENPWNATTLEWSIPSPPPFDNFAGHEPVVYRGPYEFSVPGRGGGLHSAASDARESWQGALTSSTMPGTLTDDIEIIDAGHGGGTDVPAGGDDDGEGSGGGLPRIPSAPISPRCSWLWPASSCSSWRSPVRTWCARAWATTGSRSHCRACCGSTRWFCWPAASPSQIARRHLREGDSRTRFAAGGALRPPGRCCSWSANSLPGANSRRKASSWSTNPSSSFFYLLTALHGLHLIGGIVALLLRGVARIGGVRASRKPTAADSGCDLLAFHGWAVGFLARTSLSGTVNRARDARSEAVLSSPWSGGGSPFAINSKKFGMWLFIVSDTLTFSALLLAYSYLRLANPDWPRPFEIYPAIVNATVMTVILLVSSLTMVLGVAAAHRDDRAKAGALDAAHRAGGILFDILHLREWFNLFSEGYTPWSTPAGRAAVRRHVLRHHRPAHDPRHHRRDLSDDHGRRLRQRASSTPTMSRSAACTGTSWTWSGCSCFPMIYLMSINLKG